MIRVNDDLVQTANEPVIEAVNNYNHVVDVVIEFCRLKPPRDKSQQMLPSGIGFGLS